MTQVPILAGLCCVKFGLSEKCGAVFFRGSFFHLGVLFLENNFLGFDTLFFSFVWPCLAVFIFE